MLEEVLVRPVEFPSVTGNSHAYEGAYEIGLFQGDGVLQDVVRASVHVDLYLNDGCETSRVRHEERHDVDLVLVDRGFQRVRIDKITDVNIAMQPFTAQYVLDAFQRALLDGDDERRFAILILLHQPLKGLEGIDWAQCVFAIELTVTRAALELSRLSNEIARLRTMSLQCSVA